MHSNLSTLNPTCYEKRDGKWHPSDKIMLIGGSRSKGLAGFNKYVTEAADIIAAGNEVAISADMLAEVNRYIAYKNISAQVN